jgi:hypothetical protein
MGNSIKVFECVPLVNGYFFTVDCKGRIYHLATDEDLTIHVTSVDKRNVLIEIEQYLKQHKIKWML